MLVNLVNWLNWLNPQTINNKSATPPGKNNTLLLRFQLRFLACDFEHDFFHLQIIFMKRLHLFLVIPTAVTVMIASSWPALADKAEAIEKVQDATKVFKEIMDNSKTRIPQTVLRDAQGIAVIPNVIKGGFVVGGSRGRGILVVRTNRGSWSNPSFITLTSGSIGLQVGGQSSDVILVIRDKKSVETLLTKDFSFGGNVSVAAGPVGGDVVSVNDTQRNSNIYSYAHNQGLFAGASLEGAKVAVDRDRNAEFYERKTTAQQIFTSNLPTSNVVTEFKRVLDQSISAKPK